MTFNQPVALGVGLEVVLCLNEGDAGLPGQRLAYAVPKRAMGVDAAADGRSADGQLQHRA